MSVQWCGCAVSRWVHPHGLACPPEPDPRRGVHRPKRDPQTTTHLDTQEIR